MSDNAWLSTARENLLNLSQEKKDFNKAKSEWKYQGLEDNEVCDFDCQLCGHEEIRYEYTIVNKLNANKLIIGSSCITKFVEELNTSLEDSAGEIVTKARIEDDKKEYWQKIINEKMLKNYYRTDFQKSITDNIVENEGLTIKQARYLKNFYNRLTELEKVAFRNVVKIKLRRNKHKEQINEELSIEEKNFIYLLFDSGQKKRYPDFKDDRG